MLACARALCHGAFVPARPVRRFLATFGVALAIHVAAVSAVLVTAPQRPARPSELAEREAATEMFDVGLDPSPSAAGTVAPANGAAMAMAARRETASRTAAAPMVAAEEGTASEAAPSSAAGEGFSLQTTAIDLRLAAGAGASGAERSAREGLGESSPAPISSTGGLVEGLDAKDVERGLGRRGPVRTAVDEAAHTADAPGLGVATFAVSIDRGGKIAVDVVDASVERTQWEALRPVVAERLAQKAVKLPPAHGLRVTVRVEARVEFPGGGKPTPPEKTGAFIKATPGEIVETKDHIAIVPPSIAVGFRSRKCGVGIAITPGSIAAGGGCETGVAMRVVRTRIVGEERL
jgi:hypothetical protein